MECNYNNSCTTLTCAPGAPRSPGRPGLPDSPYRVREQQMRKGERSWITG